MLAAQSAKRGIAPERFQKERSPRSVPHCCSDPSLPMKEAAKDGQHANANGGDYHDDFECTDASEERAFWKTESMRQTASSRWMNRPPWQRRALLFACTIVVASLVVAVSVSNAKADARFADLEKTVTNLSATVTSLASKMHAGRQTEQNIYREINKLKFSVEATEKQLVSMGKSLKAIDGLEPLKTLVNQLKCNLEKISSNASAENCCALGWSLYSRSCYYFSQEGMSWDSARDSCSRMHGSLATLKDDGEWTFVSKRTMPFYFWIGLSDERTGDWEWVDGTPYTVDRRHWKPGQPDDWRHHGLGGGEDCAHLHDDGRLNDDHCSRSYRFVCKASVL